ncbi:MAG: hypothetical protein HKM94_00700, partial [Halobacteria archaeon]|nr:hypothetical protein [Halobacteria archaeon]
PNFCSMKITKEVREYADKQGVQLDEAMQKGLEEKAVEFRESGSEIYHET